MTVALATELLANKDYTDRLQKELGYEWRAEASAAGKCSKKQNITVSTLGFFFTLASRW